MQIEYELRLAHLAMGSARGVVDHQASSCSFSRLQLSRKALPTHGSLNLIYRDHWNDYACRVRKKTLHYNLRIKRDALRNEAIVGPARN